jgi:PTS system cellobiose-specific IIC component
MTRAFLEQRLVPVLSALSDHTILSAIRAGMVAVVPLTIIGGLFTAVYDLPIKGWEEFAAAWRPLLQVPVTATFGVLAVFVCLAIGYDLGQRWKQEPMISATISALVFMMLQIDLEKHELNMAGLGSGGIFTAILVAIICVRVQKYFTDHNLVIKLPSGVPAMVYESFLSIVPLTVLVVAFWLVRFVANVDINDLVRQAFSPLHLALNTLPGILVYAFLVTLLWSVGINGDNTMDALVAPFFLEYLAANVEAVNAGHVAPYITALGFFTTFVNVGGTGATIALALVLWNSRDPAYRKVSRLSLPTQIFQINEPIFYGLPIVLNPVFMIPYVLNALFLTAATYLLMQWHIIERPFVNVPWTTPPIIGHYLATGGDWKAAVWGVLSIVIAMVIYYPFARVAESRRRAQEEARAQAASPAQDG